MKHTSNLIHACGIQIHVCVHSLPAVATKDGECQFVVHWDQHLTEQNCLHIREGRMTQGNRTLEVHVQYIVKLSYYATGNETVLGPTNPLIHCIYMYIASSDGKRCHMPLHMNMYVFYMYIVVLLRVCRS